MCMSILGKTFTGGIPRRWLWSAWTATALNMQLSRPFPYTLPAKEFTAAKNKNDYIANALQKYPDRFIRGLGVVNPRHGKAAVPEVDRIFKDLGLSGLLFSNDKTGLTMDNPTMLEFLQHASQYKNPVVFSYTSQYSVLQAPFMLEKIARMFPGHHIYQRFCLERFHPCKLFPLFIFNFR